jgi:uncharacterized membrane protein
MPNASFKVDPMILFAFFGIWQATLAAGVGAIAIPIIIHLINRKRFRIVPWAAMKFLLAAQKQTRKRMRIEQLLLLLVRMLILALVVFAMASVMPWAESIWTSMGLAQWGPGKKPATHRTHHVFVLDASLSMNQKVEGDQTAFEVARQMMLRKIADNSSGDGYSVLILKDSPTWLVGEASQDARKVAREIEAVRPSHGNASLLAALNMVAAKLQEAQGRFPIQAVYFFTDMQQSTWMAAAPSEVKTDAEGKQKNPYLEIQDKATTVFVDCGPLKDSGNLAVTHMEFDLDTTPYIVTGMDFTLRATVKNFGEAKPKVRAELLLGRAKDGAADPALQLRVRDNPVTDDVAATSQTTFAFKGVRFDKPGTYAVQVRIGDDALAQDNFRTVIITVRDEIPVLLVNGKASADRFERATEYLRLALNPFPAGTEPKWAPLRPKVINPSQFTDMTEAELEKFDCIFWCDVPKFGLSDVRKIDAHLRRGGGFVITLGDNAAKSIDQYNRLLYKDEQGLLPAKLMRKIAAPKEHYFYFHSTDDDYSLPPLAAFSDKHDRLTLRTARFREYVEAVVPEGKARTVLSFMPEAPNIEGVKRDDTLPINKPAIIEWSPFLSRAQQPVSTHGVPRWRGERQPVRYRGRVILLTSTVNMDWTTWPGSPSFGAMMHELTRLAISGRLREQSQTVGGVLDAYLPGTVEVDVVVKYPAEIEGLKPERAKTQLIDEVNLFRWADTDFAGLYHVETPNGHEIPFAVNVPTATSDQKASESDLRRIDENKLKETYPDWSVQIVRDPVRAMLSGAPVNDSAVNVPQPVGPDLANIALLIVLGLLFTEIVMAWRFGHYTTTEGALSKARPGMASTFIAAFIAVMSTIFFVIGAVVIFHEIRTGDFLGFLPDILRTWFERAVGVPPLQPGEGSKWVYEKAPFLFGLPGPENWYAVLLSIGAIVTIFFTYKAEAPKVSLVYKLLLGALRLYLILFTLWFVLPRPQLQYARQGWPDLVILIDDTRSMGEPDTFRDGPVIEKVKKLSEGIREKLKEQIPEKIKTLDADIAGKKTAAEQDLEIKAEVDALLQRKLYWEKQQENLQNGKWRPSRLQLVQAILAQPQPHWLKTILAEHQTKIHIFHLDINGRATKLRDLKGDAGEIINPNDLAQLKRAEEAIARLEPVGEASRLGGAVRQVIDHYRGSGLSSVIMFTDGVTTRDETLSQAADYAAQKGIPLFFVGVGDENELRDLKLHDLNVEDTIYIGDNAVFEVSLTGHGYKDLIVPVILKVKDKNGKEREVARELKKIDPSGKPVKIQLRDQPKEVGRRKYIIEVEPPKLEANEKPITPANLRLETAIEVIDTKLIKVLYVEGQPRYEFRYLKFLLEREAPNEKQKKIAGDKQNRKSIELTVLLLDADDDWAAKDRNDKGGVDLTAIRNFPPTLEDLNHYDVLIIGDCDPHHKKLRTSLDNIVAYVNGVDEKGKKATKPGGGVLFIAGALHNPHQYKGTALEKVLPVEPTQNQMPPEVPRVDRMRPELTAAGRMHPIFRFGPNEGENLAIWEKLTPMYWYSSKYRPKPLAEVLAVHKSEKAVFKDANSDGRHPLVVQQFAGSGRSMFFGFDETWRWRRGADESKFNNFWIQTMRYLSRGRSTRTELKLDRQTPYQVGEKIKVTVQFPESAPGAGDPLGPKVDATTKVKVIVEHTAPEGKESEPPRTIELAKSEGSRRTYTGTWDQTREGKLRFRLTHPDVSSFQPDGDRPSAEAIIESPPGELDKLRMDYQEMTKAAATSNGRFFTLANADKVLEVIPPGVYPLISSPVPPTLLWNQWWVFVLIVLLITSEWVLRKMKHLL